MELVCSINRARQVGKTTLAQNISQERPSVYLDLEDSLELKKAQDIVVFHAENNDKLIILAEVQRLPEVFTQLRGIIDKQCHKGNGEGLFLFLGSVWLSITLLSTCGNQ